MVDGLEDPAVDCALLELVPLSLVKAGRNGEDRQSSVEESRWRRDVAVSGKLSLCLQPADCDRALKAVYDLGYKRKASVGIRSRKRGVK